MAIAAHLDHAPGQTSFLWQLIVNLAAQLPDQRFVIFTSRHNSNNLHAPANCEIITINPPIKNRLLRQYWYQYKLPNALEKYNASFFISEQNICNLKLKTAQAMLIHELPLAKNIKQKQFEACLQKATYIFSSNAVAASKLGQQFPSLQSKLVALLPGIPQHFAPMPLEEKETVLAKFTDGFDFYLYKPVKNEKADHIAVLKAFSIFKRRLRTSFRLVIISDDGENLVPDFKNYKYRNEVLFIPAKVESVSLRIAAYAVLYFAHADKQTADAMPYLRAGIPLITANTSAAHTTYGNAALYTSISDQDIADKIMQLYKDENLRDALIQEGTALARGYSWEKSALKLAETIFPGSRV